MVVKFSYTTRDKLTCSIEKILTHFEYETKEQKRGRDGKK